ncbi:MAG: nucleotidyltransferase domain-containing protein [Candidatus Hadarchaeota archaeon]
MLAKLMMDSDKRFYIRELSKNLGIPYGMLYREVKNLVLLGILKEEKTGKVTLISANKKLPYFAELKSMMVKTAGLGDSVKNALSGLRRIRYALVYGSFASGTEAEDSDIDLLVVGDINEEEVLKAANRVEKDVGREVNYIVWSEKEFHKRLKSKHHLLAEIMENPVIMLVGDESEFRGVVKG